jgi:hypothetical protein
MGRSFLQLRWDCGKKVPSPFKSRGMSENTASTAKLNIPIYSEPDAAIQISKQTGKVAVCGLAHLFFAGGACEFARRSVVAI